MKGPAPSKAQAKADARFGFVTEAGIKALFKVQGSSSDASDAGFKAPVEDGDWDGEPWHEGCDEIAGCALPADKHVGQLLLLTPMPMAVAVCHVQKLMFASFNFAAGPNYNLATEDHMETEAPCIDSILQGELLRGSSVACVVEVSV